jgi:hypothetical protein
VRLVVLDDEHAWPCGTILVRPCHLPGHAEPYIEKGHGPIVKGAGDADAKAR